MAKYTPTAKLLAAVPPYKAQVAPPPAPVNFDFNTVPQSPITAAMMLPSGAEMLGYGSTAQAVSQQPDPFASLYVPTYEGSQEATGQFLGNQFQLPTSQPALTATQAAAQAVRPASNDSFVNQGGPVEGLTYQAKLDRATPRFERNAQSFMQSVPQTMVAPPQEQYDPQRAMTILRTASFLPLASMLTGGSADFGARLMPGMATQAIAGDKAYFDAGQAINSKYLQSIAEARAKDASNRIDLMKLAQDASTDDTRRETERSRAEIAKSELDLKAAQFRENTRQGLVEDQDKRTKTAQEIMSWLSMLEPEAQIAYIKSLSPTYRAYYGLNLPTDGKGNLIPLKRANPNEPSDRMNSMTMIGKWMDALTKDPEHITDAMQYQLIRNINNELERLGMDPDSYFAQNLPATNPLSPKDRASIAAEQARLGVLKYEAETGRMRAGTYDKSVGNQYKLGSRALDQKMKENQRKAAIEGRFGAMAKTAATRLSAVESQITRTNSEIQKLSGGHWDSLGNKWRPNPPKQVLNNEPQLREMTEQLKRLNAQRAYWDATLGQNLGMQAGISTYSPQGQQFSAPVDIGMDNPPPAATPGAAPVAAPDPEAQRFADLLAKGLGPQQ